MQADKKKRGLKEMNFCPPSDKWKRWAGFLPVRAEILAQKRFALRPIIAIFLLYHTAVRLTDAQKFSGGITIPQNINRRLICLQKNVAQ